MMRNIIKRFAFNLRVFDNEIFCKLNKNKFKYKVAIVSCNKYLNKVSEDKYLKFYLNKKFIDVDIISWEENVDVKIYDALIIRSLWGYQNKIKEFCKWINYIKDNNITVFNSVDILLSNLNKYEQFKLLDKYDIPHIDTDFVSSKDIDKISDVLKKYDNAVVKPIISGGGNDTYVVSKSIKKNNIEINEIKSKYKSVLNDINNCLMVQPFIKEIENGELSIVYLDGKISHAAYRYTSIFNNIDEIKVVSLNELESSVIDISNKISKILEYKDYLYLRADFVKIKDEYKVMEIELVEPQLFLEYRQNRKELKKFVNIVESRLKSIKKIAK